MSRDDREYPAVVWIAFDARGTGIETMCVCMPTDSGFTVADNLPYTGLPTIARDRDGDVWVAWWNDFAFDGMFWLHTYNRATATEVRVEGHGRNRGIAWTLSEPAPETWWVVLRSRGNDSFEPVARLRAGPTLDMSWRDDSPPAGLLRYKVRRECVDARYRWESEVVKVPERFGGLGARLASAQPVVLRGLLELENAVAGAVELRFYDLQGRIVLRTHVVASGSGQDTVGFDLSEATRPLRNGIYFLAARDGAGQMSEPVRVVVLK